MTTSTFVGIISGSDLEIKIVTSFLERKGLSANCIKKIIGSNRKKVRQYSKDEICKAILMHSVSPKLYEMMRKNETMTLFPLPDPSTLRKCIASFVCAPGIQDELFKLLGLKLSNEPELYKQSVLVFDEMSVLECFEYSRRLRRMFGSHKKVQVVMLRGLIYPWKQVVFFDFDCDMNKQLLMKLIKKGEGNSSL